jgi:hypothetical protein
MPAVASSYIVHGARQFTAAAMLVKSAGRSWSSARGVGNSGSSSGWNVHTMKGSLELAQAQVPVVGVCGTRQAHQTRRLRSAAIFSSGELMYLVLPSAISPFLALRPFLLVLKS